MRRVALPSGGSILITSAPSPASNSPAYSARSSAISMTRSPASMPGPALPIMSPGPADNELGDKRLGSIPACFANAFSLQCPAASGERIIPPMSDWSKVTRPIPVPNEWTKPFWEAAKRGVLELQRCQSCGHFQHPPYATCTQCVSTDLKFEPVRGLGTIYAYTIMYHTGDKRFAPAVPYTSIIVELDDAPGALMAGNLLEAEYPEAKVGRRVEIAFEKLNDEVSVAQFRLAPGERGREV